MKNFKLLFTIFLIIIIEISLSNCNLFMGIGEEDKEPPNIQITYPQDGNIYNPGKIIMTGAASDNNKVSSVIIIISNLVYTNLGSQKMWQYEWDTKNLSGLFTIELQAIDFVGNKTNISITIRIDPKIGPSIDILSPITNSFYRSVLPINFNTTDDTSIKSVFYSFDGINWINIIDNYKEKNFSFITNISVDNLNDGYYSIYIKSIDITEVETIKSVSYFINNELSNIITKPTINQVINNILEINGSLQLANQSFVSNIKIIIFTNNYMIYETNIQNSKTYNINLNTSNLKSTTNSHIIIIPTTYSGIILSNIIPIIIDHQAPSITILSPSNNSIIKGIFNLSGIASDDNFLSNIQYSWNNKDWYTIYNGVTNNLQFSINIDSSSRFDGNQELFIKSKDIFGTETNIVLSLNLNNTLSHIVELPTENQILYKNNELIKGRISIDSEFISLINIRITNNGIEKINTNLSLTNRYEMLLDASKLDSSTNTIIYIKVLTTAGLVNEITIPVIIDKENPTVSITSPQDNIYTKNSITIQGSANDDLELDSIYISTNNGLNYNVLILNNISKKTTNWSYTIDTTKFSDGDNNIWVKAIDTANRENVAKITLRINNSYPNIIITSPEISSTNLIPTIFESFVFSGSISDTYPPKNVYISIIPSNNTNYTENLTNAKLTGYSWSFYKLFTYPPYDYKVFIMAINQVDYTNTTNFQVKIDTGAPEIVITSPIANLFYSNTIQLIGYSIYSNKIKSIEYSLDSMTWNTISDNIDDFSFYFTNNLNTLNYPDSLYTLYVRAISMAGKQSIAYVPFYINNTSLSNIILSPVNNSYISGNINISGTIIGSFVSNIYISLKTNSNTIFETNILNVINYNLLYNSSEINPGPVELYIIVNNLASQSISNNIIFNIDKSGPQIFITNIENNSFVKDIITISGYALDDYQIDRIILSTNNGESFDIEISSNIGTVYSEWNYILDTTKLPEGENRIYVRVIDNASKIATTIITLKVDNTIPQFLISSPTLTDPNNIPIVSEYFVLSGTIYDTYPPKKISISINGSEYNEIQVNGFSWSTNVQFSLSYLTNTVDLMVIDNLFITNSTNFKVKIDAGAPIIIISNPSPYTYISGDIIITGTIYDNNGLKDLEYSLDSINWTKFITNSGEIQLSFSNNIPINELSDGNYTIYIRAISSSGKQTVSFVPFYIYNQGISINLNSPIDNQIVGNLLNVNGNINGSFISNVYLILSNETTTIVTNLGIIRNFNLNIDLTPFNSGNVKFTIIAYNHPGDSSTNTVNILVDKAYPSISISQPTSNSYLKGIITISGFAEDDYGISLIEYSFDSINWTSIYSGNPGDINYNYSVQTNLSNYSDKLYTLYVRITDFAGKSSYNYVSFFVNNTELTNVIYNPSDNQYINGVVNISGFITGSYLSKVWIELFTNNTKVFYDLDANYNYSTNIDFSSFKTNGVFEIKIFASNLAGQIISNSIFPIIDTNIPSISITSPSNYSFVKDNITISGFAEDDYLLTSIKLSTNNGISYDIIIENNINNKSKSFNYNLNTLNLPDGDNVLIFQASDNNKNDTITKLILKINNKTNNIIINSPIIGSGIPTILESFIFSGSIDDTYPPLFVKLISTNINGTNINTNAILSGFGWSYNAQFSPSDPTTNTIFIIAVNQVYLTNITNFIVVADKELPSNVIHFPTPGYYVKDDNYTIFGESYDDTTIDRVYISFDGINYSLVNLTNNIYWFTNINFASMSEGSKQLLVKSYDRIGKSFISGVGFILDKTSPTITLISPTNNTTVGTNVNFYFYATDNYEISNIMLIVKNYDLTEITNITNYSGSLNTIIRIPQESPKIANLIAWDKAGNKAELNINFVVNQNPASTKEVFISNTIVPLYFSGTNIIIYGKSEDSTTVSNVYFRLTNSTDWISIISNNTTSVVYWTNVIDSTIYDDGPYVLQIRSEDDLGGYDIYSTNIYIDNTPPSGYFINPNDYSFVGGILSITFSITDNISLFSFTLYTNNQLYTNIENILPTNTKTKFYTFNWDITALENGSTNTNIIMIVDLVKFTNYITNYFIVSNINPFLIIDTPKFDQWVSSNVLVSGNVISNPAAFPYEVSNVFIFYENITNEAQNNFDPLFITNSFTNYLDTKVSSEGQKYIKIRAFGRNGAFIENTIPVKVDYTPPTGSITSLTNGVSYYGTITISGTANDNFGLLRSYIEIITNNIIVSTIELGTNPGSFSTNWDTTILPVATNMIVRLSLIDYASNITEVEKVIHIRPYITSLSVNSTWLGAALTINGYNFGSGTGRWIIYNNYTNLNASAASTTISETSINVNAKSGYVKVVVNDIESINSNWLDLWTFTSGLEINNSIEKSFRFTVFNDNYYFVQATRTGGASKANTNFMIMNSSSFFYAFAHPNYNPNGGFGNSININTNFDGVPIAAIIYSFQGTAGIKIATFTNNGTTWITVKTNGVGDSMDSSVTAPAATATPLYDIRVSTDGKIHAVYSDPNGNKIRYAMSSDYGNNWTIEDVVTGLTFDSVILDAHTSIDVDSSGNPHIIYYDAGIQKLRHAWKSSGTWEIETVDNLDFNGLYGDIKIDENDTIHVSYYNGDQGDVLYMYKPLNGSWTGRITVDYLGNTGYFTSIDIKNNEKAISYFNTLYNNAWLSYYDGNNWRNIKVPQYTGMESPYGKYSGVKFNNDGTQIWVGFIDGTAAPFTMWVAKYIKP